MKCLRFSVTNEESAEAPVKWSGHNSNFSNSQFMLRSLVDPEEDKEVERKIAILMSPDSPQPGKGVAPDP